MLSVTSQPPANDNAPPLTAPVVRTSRGRARVTYASKDGVLLPLAFARRMSGWDAARGQAPQTATPRH